MEETKSKMLVVFTITEMSYLMIDVFHVLMRSFCIYICGISVLAALICSGFGKARRGDKFSPKVKHDISVYLLCFLEKMLSLGPIHKLEGLLFYFDFFLSWDFIAHKYCMSLILCFLLLHKH